MLFTSAQYLLLFLPLTVAAHWLAPRRARLWVLLVASYVFYLSSTPRYGALLAGSTIVNFVVARSLPTSRRPRALLALGVAFNLAVLAFFKYAGLLTRSTDDLLGWLGVGNGSWDGLHILLPLAISFFTFEMISVLVDVHRGELRVGGFLPFATYKAFFPKLLSGPITRYGELGPQLERPRELRLETFQSGLALFALGLVKKLAIANNVALVADRVFDQPGTATAGLALTGILAFGLQILFDFSAYTDMARGTARMLGLELPLNFQLPYAAVSPSDFWRRWHISLSRWLRDYLYIPLGGNRTGRTRRNLMITMVLGGLWHGAAWHFAVWGGAHGLLLVGSHRLRGRMEWLGRARRPLGWLVTMVGVFSAWVLFRADSLARAGEVFAALGHFSVGERSVGFTQATPLWGGRVEVAPALALMLVVILAFPLAEWLRPRLPSLIALRGVARTPAFAAATVACWTLATLFAPTVNRPFIYFRF